jgi:hypothetical protein
MPSLASDKEKMRDYCEIPGSVLVELIEDMMGRNLDMRAGRILPRPNDDQHRNIMYCKIRFLKNS